MYFILELKKNNFFNPITMCKLEEMNKISINPERLFTKSAYNKKFGVSRPTIDKMIKDNLS